jgi:hypothetical protein
LFTQDLDDRVFTGALQFSLESGEVVTHRDANVWMPTVKEPAVQLSGEWRL